jgi:hypothetical protein
MPPYGSPVCHLDLDMLFQDLQDRMFRHEVRVSGIGIDRCEQSEYSERVERLKCS